MPLFVLTVGGLITLVRSVNVPAPILLYLIDIVAGAAARDWWLSRAVVKRLPRIEAQLPDVVELLVLTVGVGQGLVSAIERIVVLDRGDLIDELSSTLISIRSGTVLSTALGRMERRVGSVHITHLCEATIAASERGIPLAEILHPQATNMREATRQDLMEGGRRREIVQIAPAIFFALLITVVSTLFPGPLILRLGV